MILKPLALRPVEQTERREYPLILQMRARLKNLPA